MKNIEVLKAELILGKNGLVNVRLTVKSVDITANPELRTGNVAVDIIPVKEGGD